MSLWSYERSEAVKYLSLVTKKCEKMVKNLPIQQKGHCLANFKVILLGLLQEILTKDFWSHSWKYCLGQCPCGASSFLERLQPLVTTQKPTFASNQCNNHQFTYKGHTTWNLRTWRPLGEVKCGFFDIPN